MQTPTTLSDALAVASESPKDEVVTWTAGDEILTVVPHRERTQHWLVGFRLSRTSDHGGELRLVEFAVRPAGDHTEALTSKTIRTLPIGELLVAARQAASRPHQSRRGRLVNLDEIYLEPFLQDSRGRAPRSDEAYAKLALVYSGLVESGDRSPAKTLAKQHGGASGTWANRVAEARRRGFLTPVKAGEAGGGLTVEAAEALGIQPEPEDGDE